MATEDRKEACKTLLEQIKLLVTLASGFILAPPAFLALRGGKDTPALGQADLTVFLVAEVFQILSVLAGYLALGSLAGSQEEGTHDIYRPATMWLSRAQVILYLAGAGVFVWFVRSRLR